MKRLIFDKESTCLSQTPEDIPVEQRLIVFVFSWNIILGRDPWNPSTSKTLMPYSQTDTCVTWGRSRKTTPNHRQVVGRDMRREPSAGYWGRGQNKSVIICRSETCLTGTIKRFSSKNVPILLFLLPKRIQSISGLKDLSSRDKGENHYKQHKLYARTWNKVRLLRRLLSWERRSTKKPLAVE